MATALDLLMSAKEDTNLLSEESDICTIDAKTRIIFVPSTIVVGGVQSDKNAERIKFSCPKIVGDNLDLSKFSVRINFENVSSVDFNVSIKDQYICDDVAVDGENVTFSWLIGRNAARYMGTVRFIVCAVKTDSDSNISVEWNTTIAEVPVLEGIEIDQPQIGQEEKDVINQLLELTKSTSAEAVQNVNSAKEQAIKDIQSVSQPDTTLTVEGGLAEAKATGEAIGSLKEDLSDLSSTTTDRFSLTAFNNGYLTNRYDAFTFENGFILSDGSDGAESKLRIRSKKYVPFFDKALVTDKKKFVFSLYKYDANGVFVESYKNLRETLGPIDRNCLYRISVVRDDSGAITPADNPIMLLYKKNEFVENDKLEKSLIKKIGAKIDKNDVEAKAYINGVYVETQSRLITKSYYLFDDNLFVRNNGKYAYSVYYFDENFEYLDNLVWKSSDRGIDAEKPVNTKYIKFGIKTANDAAITDDYETVLDSFMIVNRFDRPFIALNNVPLTYYEGLQSEYNFDTNKNASEYLQAFKMLIDEDVNATATSLGRDSSGEDMFVYTIKQASILYEKLSKKPNARPKILIVSGQHGFEKGSVYGLYYFVKDLIENYDKNDSLAYIRGNVELSIIPIANRYGFDNNLYQNANNVNLNRNYEDGFVAGEKNGSTALDQPETKLINDWIKNNSDALALIDFHTNGKQILTDWKNVNWLSIPYMEYPYNDTVYDICTRQISDNTVRFRKEFNLVFGKDVSLGHVDEWKNQPCLDSQAVLNNMIGITCEGFPAFVGAESIYDSNSMKANSEIIGNIILNLLRGFSA
uniref:Peptidase n=1 Tax=Siphoviridae sp. ctVif31 TaxID=2825532 RepID=A0A8S5Q3V0_9CAUD|nr:MAG TPA: peptidase [Siphoviridae sp. ctVif31]